MKNKQNFEPPGRVLRLFCIDPGLIQCSFGVDRVRNCADRMKGVLVEPLLPILSATEADSACATGACAQDSCGTDGCGSDTIASDTVALDTSESEFSRSGAAGLAEPARPAPAWLNSGSAPRCRLVTMGCKVNQYETQLVREALLGNGYQEAATNEPADLNLINTCTVTAEADSKARQYIRRFARQSPASSTIVFGCYAARDRLALEQLPNVAAVVSDQRELPDVLQRFGIVAWPSGIRRFDGHRRAFVKVQDGCVLRCTYCIIPQVRPGLRSRTPDEIEAEVRQLVETGYQEIVLTGIHLGHYGVELTRARSGRARFRLPHLIQRLSAIPGRWRLRLSSLEADEIDAEFLDRVADCERLSPHFHLCLQSGSDAVLARMRRRYRMGEFLKNVEQIRQRFDRPALSTDVIVGFPNETAAEFAETEAVCEQAGFMKIHAFPFSPRKGTPAAEIADSLTAEIRQDRVGRLMRLEQRLADRYAGELVGSRLSVMVEARPAMQPGSVSGTACRFVTVDFPGQPSEIGQLIDVRVTAREKDRLLGVRETVSCH